MRLDIHPSTRKDLQPFVDRRGPANGERSKMKKFFTIGQIAELLEVSTRNGVGGHQNNSTSLSMPRRCMSSLIET